MTSLWSLDVVAVEASCRGSGGWSGQYGTGGGHGHEGKMATIFSKNSVFSLRKTGRSYVQFLKRLLERGQRYEKRLCRLARAADLWSASRSVGLVRSLFSSL